jgi:hypothetical protein
VFFPFLSSHLSCWYLSHRVLSLVPRLFVVVPFLQNTTLVWSRRSVSYCPFLSMFESFFSSFSL